MVSMNKRNDHRKKTCQCLFGHLTVVLGQTSVYSLNLVCILIKHVWIFQVMSEICQNGYVDALRFLQDHSKAVFDDCSAFM